MGRNYRKLVFLMVFSLLLLGFASAEVLILNLNKGAYTEGETASAFGYVMDNTLNGINDSVVSVYLDDVYLNNTLTDADGYYAYTIKNLSSGNHTLSLNTSSSSNVLTFSVLTAAQVTSYQILASSLVVPFSSPLLNFTIKKYIGGTLVNQNYSYSVYNSTGSKVGPDSSGTSGVAETYMFPQKTGLYTVVVDNKKSFTVSVARFTLKFRITDKAGNLKNTFRPNGAAYFEVKGYSSGQKITNATVTAIVTDPTGTRYTISLTESNGIYKGNTNVTQMATQIQLKSGEYEVEVTMKDSSNNQQKIKGFFSVIGLSVQAELINKKPYMAGETAAFDIVVKNSENGNLLEHEDISYTINLEHEGKFFDIPYSLINSSDSTLSSELSITIPPSLEDGDYFLHVKASSSGKLGRGKEYLDIRNTQLFVKLSDNFGSPRDIFKPGELAKLSLESNADMTNVQVNILNSVGETQNTETANLTGTSGSISFNLPSTQGDYALAITVAISGGKTLKKQIWTRVQNYMSWLEAKNLNNEFQFTHQSGREFLAEINTFDITSGNAVDLSNFLVKFDKMVEEDTQVEYTNFQVSKNTTYSDDAAGRIVYNVIPAALQDGFYSIEYTLVDADGASFKGSGWLAISAFEVKVRTFDENGQETEVFTTGETINVSVALSTADNGTATIYREFFEPKSFSVTHGAGSTLLTAVQNELPSQAGFYGFGLKIEANTGKVGLGNGFFEIRNLNFRSINVNENGRFSPSDTIRADVVVEKAGELINETNVTLTRLVRARDGVEIPASSLAALTNDLGRATINITPDSNLVPGEYYAEIRASKGTDEVYDGFGFEIVEDKVIITINDADNLFNSNDNIEVNVKITYQNDTPKANVSVNLTGLLNLNTWAPVTSNKQGTTSSTGIAIITLSAANLNSGKYAPIINAEGLTETIVGFGEGEFEIKPFTTRVVFSEARESFAINENIQLNVTVTGTVTVTTIVTDALGNEIDVDDAYTDGVLTLHNDLNPGEYFVEVTISQGTNTVSEKLWFEILAPWMHIEPLPNPDYSPDGEINISYTIFTQGSNGWNPANATINITEIENLWTGATTPVGDLFNGTLENSYLFNISIYGLSDGDYLLHFKVIENPDYEESLYFRVNNNVWFTASQSYTPGNDNVTIIVNTSGLSGSTATYLEGYQNFDTSTYKNTADGVPEAVGSDVEFDITQLANGFYQANLRIEDGGNSYYTDIFFEIRKKEVTIVAPLTESVGVSVQFNVTSQVSTSFWILDPFTQVVLYKEDISSGYIERNYSFNYAGSFLYSYGQTKWDAFPNADEIDIYQAGFDVVWPYDDFRYVLSAGKNLSFNVTSDHADTPITLKIKNHFTGNVIERTDLATNSSPGSVKEFSFDLQDLGLQNGPHDVELTLQDGSSQPPRSFFFIDVFPDQYEINAWTNSWDIKSGEMLNIPIEVYDVLNGWNKTGADAVSVLSFEDQFGSPVTPTWANFTMVMLILQTDDTYTTGNYHLELNITKGGASRIVPLDFFVRGNDNLEVFWDQDKWEYAITDTFTLRIDVRDTGDPVSGVKAQLTGFEKWPESFDQEPVDMLASINSAANFTNDNATDSSGRVTFTIDLSAANLATGGYTGRINMGGQMVWFDFNVRSYMVDAYTTDWDYGIADTIEINIRSRNIDTWTPINENGNVTIKRITRHEPGMYMPKNVNLSSFNIVDPVYTVTNGEAFIEMLANQTSLALDKAYEFEVMLEMNLSGSGVSEGFAWFRLSNDSKPSASIVDRTGSEPDTYFGGQTYTLQVTNVESATLKNMWGPGSKAYNKPLAENNATSAFEVNFTTPDMPGFYTLEVEVMRSGFLEYLYQDFTIGSGTELNLFMISGDNVIPGVNFTVYASLFGEGVDPWCANDPFCTQDWTWFGPLANKTIRLEGIKDLETFTFTNLSSLNITRTTNDFPSMSPGGGPGKEDMPMGPGFEPGNTLFNLHPDVLNLSPGRRYDLVFGYTDDEGQVSQNKKFIQVEKFHVAISRRERNIGAKSIQWVWLKATLLNATPLADCSIIFNAMYSEKDYQLVKSLNINEQTAADGTVTFNFTSPSLPGFYFVQGTADCNISGEMVKQDIAYSIDVGAKNLEVDMKTKFKEGENIKVLVTTKDRLGNPDSLRLNINLFHDRDDYPYPIYSLGGADCTVLDANQDWNHGGGNTMANNWMDIETDANGKYELELCPMPAGAYMMDIFPIFEFGDEGMAPMEGPMDDFGFFSDFLVSSADISVESEISYMVDDNVTLNITALDENGVPIQGQIVAMDAVLEIFGAGVEKNLLLFDTVTPKNLSNGFAQINYKINATAPDEDNDTLIYPVTPGPVWVYILIQDENGKKFIYDNLQHVIVKSSAASITTVPSVKTNRLINVSIVTDNAERYKAQTGVFFQKDNTEKEKEWFIEGGVFLENLTPTTSGADFKILSPREPATYYLAVPIYKLEVEPDGINQASELLITEIEVTLDLVNVTGLVTEDDGSTPIEGALVRIGKKETMTNATGSFELKVPKGKVSIEVEKKTSSGLKQIMKTDKYNFDTATNINISLYRFVLSGNLTTSYFNISSPSTDLSTMKLRINISINNTGIQNFTNFSIRALAMSGEEIKTKSVGPNGETNAFFRNLDAGFETDNYELTVLLKATKWNSTPYVHINGADYNASVSAELSKTYAVTTYAVEGDSLDNDNDCNNVTRLSSQDCTPDDSWYEGKCIDEEINNNKDDDCDGKIDEDLEGTNYFEWCGNGFCSSIEAADGSCFEDCAQGFCGDAACDEGEDTWCSSDCNVTTCSPANTCASDGSPQFCNNWGILELAQWCQSQCDSDNCWACTTAECTSKGCTLGQDGYGNEWCFKEETCGNDACWACHSSTNCGSTSACEWEIDSNSPDGGWCNRLWDCNYECGACSDEPACTSSNASMDNTSCVWKADNQGAWCMWNFTNQMMGGIDNIWLGQNRTVEDWQSVVDWKCWTGNCGANILAGDYFVLLRMGDMAVDIKIDGVLFESKDNQGGTFQDFATNYSYTFNNGTHSIEIIDTIGPDYINWTLIIGEQPSAPDNDGDGYDNLADCNDNNASIHPGAIEICDGVDNNCNTIIDEGCGGQGSNTLSGYILDSNNNPVEGASVRLYKDMGPDMQNNTDATGYYEFVQVNNDSFWFEAMGGMPYQFYIESNQMINVNESFEINLTLYNISVMIETDNDTYASGDNVSLAVNLSSHEAFSLNDWFFFGTLWFENQTVDDEIDSDSYLINLSSGEVKQDNFTLWINDTKPYNESMVEGGMRKFGNWLVSSRGMIMGQYSIDAMKVINITGVGG